MFIFSAQVALVSELTKPGSLRICILPPASAPLLQHQLQPMPPPRCCLLSSLLQLPSSAKDLENHPHGSWAGRDRGVHLNPAHVKSWPADEVLWVLIWPRLASALP